MAMVLTPPGITSTRLLACRNGARGRQLSGACKPAQQQLTDRWSTGCLSWFLLRVLPMAAEQRKGLVARTAVSSEGPCRVLVTSMGKASVHQYIYHNRGCRCCCCQLWLCVSREKGSQVVWQTTLQCSSQIWACNYGALQHAYMEHN